MDREKLEKNIASNLTIDLDVEKYIEITLLDIEKYANQRVIEELENFEKNEFSYTYGDGYISGVNYIQYRIKQIKQ